MSSPTDRSPEKRQRSPENRAASPSANSSGSIEDVAVPFDTATNRDRVIARLRKNEVVSDEQLQTAWIEWSRLRDRNIRVPLWRLLTMDQSIDADEIYVEAASVYAFKELDLDEKATIEFIESCK